MTYLTVNVCCLQYKLCGGPLPSEWAVYGMLRHLADHSRCAVYHNRTHHQARDNQRYRYVDINNGIDMQTESNVLICRQNQRCIYIYTRYVDKIKYIDMQTRSKVQICRHNQRYRYADRIKSIYMQTESKVKICRQNQR